MSFGWRKLLAPFSLTVPGVLPRPPPCPQRYDEAAAPLPKCRNPLDPLLPPPPCLLPPVAVRRYDEEAAAVIEHSRPPRGWPSNGAISVKVGVEWRGWGWQGAQIQVNRRRHPI